MKDTITLADIEAAINTWRRRLPSEGEAHKLCAQAAALATPYAAMIITHRHEIAVAELDEAARAALAEAGQATAA